MSDPNRYRGWVWPNESVIGALGIFGMVVIAVLAAVLFPVFARARAKALQNTCQSNVKQIATGLLMYAADDGNRLPPAERWPECDHWRSDALHICPTDVRPEKQTEDGHPASYTMNAQAGGLRVPGVAEPEGLVLVFEGTKMAGGPEAVEFRHNGGLNLAYADGHGKWVGPTEFSRARFEPAAKP